MYFWLTLIVSAMTDFVIGAGGCLTTAMVATGSTTMPTAPVMIFAIVTGAVTAARRVQALLQSPPLRQGIVGSPYPEDGVPDTREKPSGGGQEPGR